VLSPSLFLLPSFTADVTSRANTSGKWRDRDARQISMKSKLFCPASKAKNQRGLRSVPSKRGYTGLSSPQRQKHKAKTDTNWELPDTTKHDSVVPLARTHTHAHTHTHTLDCYLAFTSTLHFFSSSLWSTVCFLSLVFNHISFRIIHFELSTPTLLLNL